MKKTLLVVAIAIMAHGGIASAAVTSQGVYFEFNVPHMFELSWGVNGSKVELTRANAITPQEVSQGFKEEIPGGTLVASANVNYDISVMAINNFFQGGGGTKPVSDLMVSINGQGYAPVMGSSSTLLFTGAPEFNGAKGVKYKLKLNQYDAGCFMTVLTYTISASGA